MKLVFAVVAVAVLGRAAAADPMYSCHAVPADTKLYAEFRNPSSLADLATWVLGFSCKTIIFTPEVAKRATKVNIMAPNAMTPKQALKLFVDAVEATGLTVVDKGDTLVIKPGPKMPASCPDLTEAAAPAVTTPPATTPPVTAAPADEITDADLDSGITVVDATHVTATRALRDKVLANPMAAARSLRVVPAMKNGKPDGFKLYAIRPHSIADRLGLHNGDTLVTINGFDLGTPEQAVEVYDRIHDADALELGIERKGAAVSVFITIR